MLTHRERLLASINDDPALDRAPVAQWPDTLAASTLAYQRTFDFDLVKVTPASSFSIRDWGAEDLWEGNPEGTRRYTKRVITNPQDWEKLPVLEPSARYLSAQLECLRLLRKELGKETPLLQTIFSPLSQAKNLVGGETLIVHLREQPEAVMKGLEIITETTRRFISAAIETGIDGIFYAVQHAQTHLLSSDEFALFGVRQDIALLNQANGLWCNMVHLHGINIQFENVVRYPATIFNWHDRETAWSLAEGQKHFSGVVCGGLSRETVVLQDQAQIKREAADAIEQTRSRSFILGTGCVVPITAPYGNIMAARKSVERQP
jgi:uroporphyrinogen decarboxylase